MDLSFESIQRTAVSVIGALFFASVFVIAATPVLPIA